MKKTAKTPIQEIKRAENRIEDVFLKLITEEKKEEVVIEPKREEVVV